MWSRSAGMAYVRATKELDSLAGTPFMLRQHSTTIGGAPVRAPQSKRIPLYKILIIIVAAGIASTAVVSWWMQRSLPVSQKRAKESEALLAPPSQSFCRRSRPPMVCAHGGDTTAAPPNTAAAFRAALAGGADCVEIDAALSRDGVLVVMHVRELAQLLGKQGMQVGDLPAADMLALRWPGSGEHVLSVADAVRLTSPFVDCVTLDVKTYNDKDGVPLDELRVAEAVVRLVHDTRCGNCLVWAKSDRVVRRVLELSPGQRSGYIVMNETAESRALGMHKPLRLYDIGTVSSSSRAGGGGGAAFRAAAGGSGISVSRAPGSSAGGDEDEGGAYGSQPGGAPPAAPGGRTRGQPGVVGVHHGMVEQGLLEQLHGAGKQLFAWTINEAEHLKAVLDVGVDALVTNYPLTALEAIEHRLSQCGRRVVLAGRSSTGQGGGRGGGGTGGRGGGKGAKAGGRPRSPVKEGDYL